MKRFLFLSIFFLTTSVIHSQKQWTLQECLTHALENNLSLKQTELGISFEEIAQKQAKGNRLPSFNASASHGYNFGRTLDPFTNDFISERIQSNQFGLQSGITIFNGFKLMNAYKRTAVAINKSRLELEKLQNDVSLNVANSYLNILYNQEFLAIAERNVLATVQQYDLIQKQVNAGALPQGSLYEIEAQKATDEASVINAQNNLEMSFLILKQLIQSEEDIMAIQTPEITEISSSLMPSSSQGLLLNALENFPEIKVVEQELLDAGYGLKIAEGAKYPSLFMRYNVATGFSGARKIGVNPQTLIYPIGVVESSGETVVTFREGFADYEVKPFGNQFNENINHSLGLNLSIPIFNGWSTANNIERAKLNTVRTEYRMEAVKQSLQQEVEKAWLDAKAAWKNYETGQKTVTAAKKAYEYAQVKYDQGVINLVEFNLSRTQLDNATAQMIRNKYDYIFKVKVLEFYQGKPISNF